MAGGDVTVGGGQNSVYTLHYNTNETYNLARVIAYEITQGIENGTLAGGLPNDTVAATGTPSEFVATQDGVYTLSSGFKAVVDTADYATIYGSGERGQSVMAGAGNLTFSAVHGSGTVIAGGGNDSISVTHGAWDIVLGKGHDTVDARGGNDTITAGSGKNYIALHSGTDLVSIGGSSTVQLGTGHATIFANSPSGLSFGGHGSSYFATPADGSGTLEGLGRHSGGHSGSPAHGADAFLFIKGQAGGDDLINNWKSSDKLIFQGYSQSEVAYSLSHADHTPQGLTLTLSDKTTITFADVQQLNRSSIIVER